MFDLILHASFINDCVSRNMWPFTKTKPTGLQCSSEVGGAAAGKEAAKEGAEEKNETNPPETQDMGATNFPRS